MKTLNAIKAVFDKILEVLGIICLSVMTIMIVYQVVARYVFNSPSAISEALAQFLFVWMIMFGSAYVYGSLEHLTIDLLKDKFPPKMNMIVEVVTNVCLFIFVLLIFVLRLCAILFHVTFQFFVSQLAQFAQQCFQYVCLEH